MSTFASVLKLLRTTHGYTQDELSSRLNITRSRLGMYEAGKREPDFETLEAIADFFNVDMNYLLGKTDKTTYIPGSQTDNRMKLPGYFKQYIFEEDIASYALKLKREPVLKEILDAVELLNDSNRRIILFLAGKLKEEQGK